MVFAQSKLNIKSLDGNHKALYSTAVVYSAGTDEKVKKHNGSNHSFTLLPGVYDVKVTCNPIKTDKWLRSIALKANDQLEKQVQFALGKIKLTDDKSDGQATRGQFVFIRKAPPPLNRFKAPFKLANGRSVDFAYPASDQVTAIEFHISQGAIHIKQVQPK